MTKLESLRKKVCKKVLQMVVSSIVKIFLDSLLLMILWNLVMVSSFHVNKISFFGSMGIKIIINILFKHKNNDYGELKELNEEYKKEIKKKKKEKENEDEN